ncbi:MAG TPA: hypothetical protein VNZ02_00360 [Steroidobacteraceae bacterium]|jgi:hypothetical protein|nr:hypothetical protein [Steroidobacteraceae bacterium]
MATDGMHTFLTILLVIGFCAVLPLVLLSVVSDLIQRIAQHGPPSRNHSIIQDQGIEHSGR